MQASGSHLPSGTPAALPQTSRRRPRFDLRVALGILLLLGGTVTTVVLIRQAGERTPVLVAARAVPAGQVVGEDDVTVAELGVAPGIATLGVGERASVVGHVAAAPLTPGQVLHPGVVADGLPLATGEVAMSVPVTRARAVGGAVQPGQWVRLVATSDQAGPRVVAERVRVLAATIPARDQGVEATGSVTVAVPAVQAPGVAGATRTGGVDVLLLPGAEESQP